MQAVKMEILYTIILLTLWSYCVPGLQDQQQRQPLREYLLRWDDPNLGGYLCGPACS